MNLFGFIGQQVQHNTLEAHVHDWLEKRRAIKRAEAATLEAMIEDRYPNEVNSLFEAEDKLWRELTKTEVAIDRLLT